MPVCQGIFCWCNIWNMCNIWKQVQYLKFKWLQWWDSNPRHLVCRQTLSRLAKMAKWLNCVVSTYLCGLLTVCFENVKFMLRVNLHSVFAWILKNSFFETCNIWNLSDCNGNWTHSPLVRKWVLNYSTKMAMPHTFS